MSQNDLIEFCNTVRDRSNENLKSFKLLVDNQNYGVAVGLVRQEIDSLIRVAYLYNIGNDETQIKRLPVIF
jgi:hypothetical protein